MLLAFTYGVIFGILLILLIFYIFLSNPFEKSANKRTFVEQFPPLRLPPELKKFLGSCEDDSHSKWETCFCLSLLFHFLFQEHKDTRFFRRWLYERLQLELSDLTTRSAAGRLIQDVRIRDLSVGSHFPVIKKIRIENYEMFEEDGFNSLNFLVDVDYTGGFQTSIDLAMVLRRFAQMSIKVTRLSGKVRLTMTRKPFTHWTISFVEMPILDMKIETHWQGKQLKHVIPFITQQFRRIIQRKHIWPSYKIRYRPFFTNPILIPSHPTDSYNHIKIMGVLEVTILQCTRLNTSLSPSENAQVHCTVSLGHQPLHYSSWNSLFSITVLLSYIRNDLDEPVGLTFEKSVSVSGFQSVRIASVATKSAAEKCGFKIGDIVLAINNVPIRNERQLGKLLCGTLGDLNVLVQRTVYDNSKDINNEDGEVLIVDEITDIIETPFLFDDGQKKSENGSRIRKRQGQLRSRSMPHLLFPYSEIFSSLSGIDYESSDHLYSANDSKIGLLKQRVARSEVDLQFGMISDYKNTKSVVPRSRSFVEIVSHSSDAKVICGTNIIGKHSCISQNSMAISTNESVIKSSDCLTSTKSLKEQKKILTRRERIRMRAAEVAAASKAKMSNFWYRRKDNLSEVEVAFDATEELIMQQYISRSPSPPDSKERWSCKSEQIYSSDKEKDNTKSFPSEDDSNLCNKQCFGTKTLRTKSLQLSENILWGQSLHFELDSKDRYLNISIFAEFDIESGHTDSRNGDKTSKSNMLGYTSIYVPQILDDCRLTLSNCHREIYSLKPPENPTSKRPISPLIEEASRHAGFDSRICYGDILIGFRYFPSGLPKETEATQIDNALTLNSHIISNNDGYFDNHFPSSSTVDHLRINHHFENFILKKATICGVCNGKIWFKNASRCSRCLLVCHNKCTVKNFKLLICDPCDHFEDDTFEVLDNCGMIKSEKKFSGDVANGNDLTEKELGSLNSTTEQASNILAENNSLKDELLQTRRRRIANKVTEKWNNTWNKMARRKISDSHKMELSEDFPQPVNVENRKVLVKNVIPDVLVDLDVPSCLSNMMFQPGDAYDENLIQEAKNIGKSLFLDLNWPERKIKINSQIDRIQKIIDKTTAERLKLITNLKSPPQKRDEFNIIDDRLQALAMLMLHYCAALQDCIDREEESEHFAVGDTEIIDKTKLRHEF